MATHVVTNGDGTVTVCIGEECVTVSCPEAASAGTWPGPIGTYLVAPEHELELAIAELREREPLVLRHAAGEPIDLQVLGRIAGRTAVDGRDVVIVVDDQP